LLGDAKSSLGDAKSSLGDADISLGGAKSSLGDADISLGDAKSSLGDADISLGGAKGYTPSPLAAESLDLYDVHFYAPAAAFLSAQDQCAGTPHTLPQPAHEHPSLPRMKPACAGSTQSLFSGT
jgi:hypothetical protein